MQCPTCNQWYRTLGEVLTHHPYCANALQHRLNRAIQTECAETVKNTLAILAGQRTTARAQKPRAA